MLVVSGSRSERNPRQAGTRACTRQRHFPACPHPAEADEPITDGRRVRDFARVVRPAGAAQVVTLIPMRLGRVWNVGWNTAVRARSDREAHVTGLQFLVIEDAQAAGAHVRTTLPQLFVTGSTAETELVAADGKLLRVDRLVEIDGTLWVIDFKWRMTEQERPQYEAQVRRYAELLRSVHGQTVRMGIVTAAAMFAEIDAQDTADST